MALPFMLGDPSPQVIGNAPMLGIVVAMETFCGQVTERGGGSAALKGGGKQLAFRVLQEAQARVTA